MSEQAINTEMPAEAPAESVESPDWQSALDDLEQAYDSQQPPEDSQETVDGEEEQASAPNLSSAEWRDLSERFDGMTDYIVQQEEERLIGAALERIKGGADLTISDETLRELATGHFQSNPKALSLWRNQRNDPDSLNRYLSRYGGQIQQQFGKRDLTETSDIEAIEALVRGGADMTDGRRAPPPLPPNPTRKQLAEWQETVLGPNFRG